MRIDLEKKKLEKKKVLVAADEKQIKIYERLEEIERLKKEIDIQKNRATELEEEIKQLEGENNG